MKSLAPLGLAAFAIAAGALLPAPAHAWWRGGVFIGLPPVVVGPPVAYPPPYYPYGYPYYYPPAPYAPYAPGYAPPPAAAGQPTPQPQMSQAEVPFGATCYAGVYTCAAPEQTRVGTGCSCPGLGAPSYGVVQ